MEGLVQGLLIFQQKCSAPVYRCLIPDSILEVYTRPATADVRPFVIGAVLRGVTMTPDCYHSFIDLQVNVVCLSLFDDIIMVTYGVMMVDVLVFVLGQRTEVCIGYIYTCDSYGLLIPSHSHAAIPIHILIPKPHYVTLFCVFPVEIQWEWTLCRGRLQVAVC